MQTQLLHQALLGREFVAEYTATVAENATWGKHDFWDLGGQVSRDCDCVYLNACACASLWFTACACACASLRFTGCVCASLWFTACASLWFTAFD